MTRRPDGVAVTSIFYLLTGTLWLLLGCALLTIPLIVAAGTAGQKDSANATAITGIVVLLAVGLLAVLAVAYLVVGWGLWRLRDWARLSAIALAVISLLAFPVGTLVGGVVIWYLLTPAAVEAFRPGGRKATLPLAPEEHE